jgi:hypothetical protein
MRYIEYLHLKLMQIFSHSEEFQTDTEMYWAFQQSTEPEKLGFKYERDFTEIDPKKPETV